MPRDFLERFPRKPIPEPTMNPVGVSDVPLEETQLAPKTNGVEDQTALIEGAARADFTELYRRIKIAQEEDPTFCPPAMLQRVEEAERLARENSALLNLPEDDDRNPLGFITQKNISSALDSERISK